MASQNQFCRPLHWIFCVALALALNACGGGGGGGGAAGTTNSLPVYSGLRTAAVITRPTAAYIAGGFQSSITLVRAMAAFYIPPPQGDGTIDSQPILCADGGSVTPSGTAANGRARITYSFANCDEGGVLASGVLYIDSAQRGINAKLNFRNYTVTVSNVPELVAAGLDGVTLTINGQLDYRKRVLNGGQPWLPDHSFHWSADFSIKESISGDEIWANDLEIDVVDYPAPGSLLQPYSTEVVAGRIYENSLGYVDISSAGEFRYTSQEDSNPYWGDRRVFAGADGASVIIDPLSPSALAVLYDSDGDELADQSRVFSWQDLDDAVVNENDSASSFVSDLVANAGRMETVETGQLAQVSAIRSYSGNEWLNFEWHIALKPAGSNAVLNNSLTPEPTFVADKTGHYLLSVKVSSADKVRHLSAVVVARPSIGTPADELAYFFLPQIPDADVGERVWLDDGFTEFPVLYQDYTETGWFGVERVRPTAPSNIRFPVPHATENGRRYFIPDRLDRYKITYGLRKQESVNDSYRFEREIAIGPAAKFYEGVGLFTDATNSPAAWLLSYAGTDLDGDGLTDLYLNHANDSAPYSATFLKGNGQTGFSESVVVESTGNTFGVFTADIDADGSTEFVSGSCNFLHVVNDAADGSAVGTSIDFSSSVDMCQLYGSFSMLVGDLNGDGWDDLSIARTRDPLGQINWLQDGSGNLNADISDTYSHPRQGATSADINKDGLIDQIYFADKQLIRIEFRRSDGAYGPIQNVALPSIYSAYWSSRISVADWNDDGLNDILFTTEHRDFGSATNEHSFFAFMLQEADGTFGSVTLLPLGVGLDTNRVKVGFLDGDNLPDAFIGPDHVLLENIGNQSIPMSLPYSAALDFYYIGTDVPSIMDLNSDGMTDLVFDGIGHRFNQDPVLGVYLQRPRDRLH